MLVQLNRTNLNDALNCIKTRITPSESDALAKRLSHSDVRAALSDSAEVHIVSRTVEEHERGLGRVKRGRGERLSPYFGVVGMVVRVLKDIERHGIVLLTGFNGGRMYPIRSIKKERSLEERTETSAPVSED